MNSLKNDYSSKSLTEIKNEIRQNGELDAQTTFILNTAASPNGQTISQNYGKYYNDWKNSITHYKTYYPNYTNQQIKNIVRSCN